MIGDTNFSLFLERIVRKLKHFNTILLVFGLLCSVAFAHTQTMIRETIGALSSSSSSGKMMVQATAGQSAVVSSNMNSTGKLYISEGFHRSTVRTWVQNDFSITAFPNPTTDQFNFHASLPEHESFEFFIFDINGRLLQSGKAFGQEWVNVSLLNERSGMYFLNVRSRYKSVTFKVDKING
jgi:hypothetical protein